MVIHDKIQEQSTNQWHLSTVKCLVYHHIPDFNPVENMFHLLRKKLHEDAREHEIKQETYKEFSNRV